MSTRRQARIKLIHSAQEHPTASLPASSEYSNAGRSTRANSTATAINIWRSFNADEINPVLNHPSVFPFVTVPGIEKFDATPIIANPRNVLLMANGGGILFVADEPGIYEVHTNFLQNYRGRYALNVSRECYRWMFTHTDCMTLQTRVPQFNKAADLFCRWVGAIKEFEREKVWPTKDGLIDMSFWSLKYEDWIRKADILIESGRRFHNHLDSEYARHGKEPHSHLDEDCHDRYVGACAEMIYGGQPEKAVILYNRWARFAGYAQLTLVSKFPTVIDMGESILEAKDNDFKVVMVR